MAETKVTFAGEIEKSPWTSWTPAWTNFTVGDATQVAAYTVYGKTAHFRVRVTLGSTSAVTGTITLTLPVTKATALDTAVPIGVARFYDISAPGTYPAYITAAGTVIYHNTGGTYSTDSYTSASLPFVWASGDLIYISGTYETA